MTTSTPTTAPLGTQVIDRGVLCERTASGWLPVTPTTATATDTRDTRIRIATLRAKACAAGDTALVEICDLALACTEEPEPAACRLDTELVECVDRIVAERDTLARGLRAAIEWSSSGRPSITADWPGLEGRVKVLHDVVVAARALLDGPRREPPVEDEPPSWDEERHP